MPRAATQRPAEFSAVDADAILHRGIVVDLSPNGLQLRTRTPEPVGRFVEIELHPKAGSPRPGTLLVRGRIVRVERLDNGEFALGVRLMVQFEAPGSVGRPRVSTHEEARSLVADVSALLKAPPSGQTPALTIGEDLIEEGAEVTLHPTAEPNARKKRRRVLWTLFWLGMIVGVLLILLSLRGCGIPVLFGLGGHAKTSPEPAEEAEQGPSQALQRAQDWLEAGKPELAQDLFAAAMKDARSLPVERFMARIGRAEALAVLNQRAEALETLDRGDDAAEGISRPWREAAAQYRAALAAPASAGSEAAALSGMKSPGDVAAAATPAREARPVQRFFGTCLELGGSTALPGASSEFRIAVDTREYLLTVFRDNTPLGVFPVGLGMDNSTPRGAFVVANKIVNPDWFNHGEVVKSGDPKNPLGSRWMGLGNPRGPTPYGIHSTPDAGSIGKNQSRGCVRMLSKDAEQVFAWCPVGTPVSILP